MPTYKWGNIWRVFDKADYFCLITNGSVKTFGLLVMGKDEIVIEAIKRFPLLPRIWGSMTPKFVTTAANAVYHRYGLLLPENIPEKWKAQTEGSPIRKLIGFQTKLNWKRPALPDLIELSTSMLKDFAEKNPDKSIHLPMPGIGIDRLTPEEVYPIIHVLPSNVHVWNRD